MTIIFMLVNLEQISGFIFRKSKASQNIYKDIRLQPRCVIWDIYLNKLGKNRVEHEVSVLTWSKNIINFFSFHKFLNYSKMKILPVYCHNMKKIGFSLSIFFIQITFLTLFSECVRNMSPN